MTTIDITNITGLSYPYDIYVCDIYGNNCILISTVFTSIPPNNTILLPPQFNTSPSVGIKVITLDGCEKFKIIDCYSIEPPLPFISVWVTSTPSESITLPYEPTGGYYGTIDWGDGTITSNIYADRTHTYTTPGTYTITITGTLIGWSFFVNPISKDNILEILQWGCLRLGNSGGNFYVCNNLSLSNVNDVLNLTGTNNLSLMFAGCPITNVPYINSWDTSNVTNMYGMFNGCSDFDDNIGSWDVLNVTDMNQMFESNNLFNNGGSPTISNWDTVSVTNMNEMFFNANSFNQPLSGWNVSNVTDMGFMFSNSLFNQDINNWDVSNVINMSNMFSTSPFNQTLGGWDVSNVTDMSYMFSSTPFNQDINSWNVSNVTTMEGIFFFNTTFNQILNLWDVSSVTNMDYVFWLCYAFNGDVTTWNTSNVTTMRFMFGTCTNFNQNISSWNVGNVTNMSGMFNGAQSFNQPIGSWDVGNVTTMQNMFGSGAFNQNIGSWNVTGVTNFNQFMYGKTYTDFSTTNLNAIYNGWSALPTLQPSININFGTIKYTAGGSAGKVILQGTYGWTITDGGI